MSEQSLFDTLRLHGARDLRLHREARPQADVGEGLLQIGVIGICASDLHWYCEGAIGEDRLERAVVPGHEFAGVVAEEMAVGGLAAGTRVAVDPAVPCGRCPYCEQGHPNLCPDVTFSGHGAYDGAMRQYMAWPASTFHPLPDSVSLVDGAMLEPLGVAIHAVDLGHVRPGMTVAILGCGPIGLLTLQVARLAGATQIVATDNYQHRLLAARELGAGVTIQAQGGAENEEFLAAIGGEGAHVVFEAAGENSAVETAMAVARPSARVVLIGIPDDDRTSFRAAEARRKGLTIVMVRRMKHTYPRALQLVEKGLVGVRSLVTHRFPLAEFQQAFDIAVRREGIKVVLEPWAS